MPAIPDLTALQTLLQPLFPGLMGVTLTEATPDRLATQTQLVLDAKA